MSSIDEMYDSPPIVTFAMNLVSIKAVLKKQEDLFQHFMGKLEDRAQDAGINEEDIAAILSGHLATLTCLASRGFPSVENLSPLQSPVPLGGSVSKRCTTSSSRSATARRTPTKKSPTRIPYAYNQTLVERDNEEDNMYGPAERVLNSFSQRSKGSRAKKSHSAADLGSTKEPPRNNFSTSFVYSFGTTNSDFGESTSSRGARGGAGKLFGATRNGSRPHTPIKPRRKPLSSVMVVDSDSEDAEAEEDVEDSLFVNDSNDDNNRRSRIKRNTRKADEGGWMSGTQPVVKRHEAANRRAEEALKSIENQKDEKRNKKNSSSSSKKAETGSKSKERRFTRPNDSDDDNDDDDEQSDISPTEKQRKGKISSHSSTSRKRKHERQRQRDAKRIALLDVERKKVVDNYMNSHKTFTKMSEPIEISSDDDEVVPTRRKLNFSSSTAPSLKPEQKRNSSSSVTIPDKFRSPMDIDKESGYKERVDTSAVSTPSRKPKGKSVSLPLRDQRVGSSESTRTLIEAGSDTAMASEVETEIEIEVETENEIMDGQASEVFEPSDSELD